ncbi:MAG: T9SS type A sorting domain-containing protein, partial [Chitinophagaceae bacterium]
IKNLGVEDRVLGMTFSEFGRRVKSNASVGTDHGSAAPLFLFGKKVNPGITGNNPTIPAAATVNDNVPMQYDFRSIYASVLQDWFCVDNTTLQTIMLQNFQKLPILAPDACSGTTAVDFRETGVTLIKNYPNPFTETTTISFTTKGGHTLVQIMDALGRVIRTPIDREYTAGTYQTTFDSYGLPAGVYYMRFQNGVAQQVKAMLKVR